MRTCLKVTSRSTSVRSGGIGQKGFDNGIVFLIKPNGPPGQRKVFIATGYGLEGAIPDLRAKQVVDGVVIPHFKQGDHFGGIDQAVDLLMAMAKGEYNEQIPGQGKRAPVWPMLLVMLFIFGVIFLSWRKRVNTYARHQQGGLLDRHVAAEPDEQQPRWSLAWRRWRRWLRRRWRWRLRWFRWWKFRRWRCRWQLVSLQAPQTDHNELSVNGSAEDWVGPLVDPSVAS